MAEETAIAVIMVGGPTKGTRFRPLSLHTAKPLFPIAGQPMVHHPLLACKKITNLQRIYLIGFHEEKEFALYMSSVSNELQIPIRYLKEDKAHGSAGGLLHFRDELLEDNPKHIFVINCDVCSSFPLPGMLEAHKLKGGMGTLLVKKVSPEAASEFGELVADPETKELLHYAEKPETFVSEWINCGVYLFSPQIFDAIQSVASSRRDQATLRRVASFDTLPSPGKNAANDFVRLDQDILTPYAGKKALYTYETTSFWEQIKTPALSLRCSELYLKHYQEISPSLLAKSEGPKAASIIGDVFIHPSAKVHPTAKIGPNVSIAANARIGPGVRLLSCIILDSVEIMDNAIVMHAIIGWKSTIGRWGRVQGGGDYNAKLGISILGEDVVVEDEVVVVNCIVLPHKSLSSSVREEIIL